MENGAEFRIRSSVTSDRCDWIVIHCSRFTNPLAVNVTLLGLGGGFPLALNEYPPFASVDTAGMFHDGFTDAFETPLCAAVSTTLPETDHVFDDGVGDGSVGEPLDADDPPPHAVADRIANPVEARRTNNLDTVTVELASATPTSDRARSQSPDRKLSIGVFSPCTLSHRHQKETVEQKNSSEDDVFVEIAYGSDLVP